MPVCSLVGSNLQLDVTENSSNSIACVFQPFRCLADVCQGHESTDAKGEGEDKDEQDHEEATMRAKANVKAKERRRGMERSGGL